MTAVMEPLAVEIDNRAMSAGAANRTLLMNTLAFTVCFAVWTMYGVLVAFLVDHRVLEIGKAEMGWLIGVPILTGSLLRLPVGVLTDRYGGRPVFVAVMLFSALGLVGASFAEGIAGLVAAGLAFGVSGTGFACGIAYTSLWFPRERQGTALGIFGMGNAGSAVTSLGAPHLLNALTRNGQHVEGWRQLPLIYAGGLVGMAALFWLFTQNRKVDEAAAKTLPQMLRPLRDVRVWRFGLYYFIVFGAFVALAQWLIPYYLNVYGMSLATAGLMAAVFSLPSGVIRALGGWASDRFGARATMYWVLSSCALLFFMLVAPRMEITSPGEGIQADRAGTVTAVSATSVTVGDRVYPLQGRRRSIASPKVSATAHEGDLIVPTFESWQEPAVRVGQTVKKKELVARGVTRVFFQANVWVFTGLVFLAGIMMGIGKAAVYRHIPDYFPHDVGVVGGLVGVIGGLGGFFCPVLFGWMLHATGLWTTCWLFLGVLTVISLVWMHVVILRMAKAAQSRGSGS